MFNNQPDTFLAMAIEILSTGLADIRDIETSDDPETLLTVSAAEFHSFILKKTEEHRSDGYLAIISVKHYNYLLNKYGKAPVEKLLSMTHSVIGSYLSPEEAFYATYNTFIIYFSCSEDCIKEHIDSLLEKLCNEAPSVIAPYLHYIVGVYHLAENESSVSDIIHKANDSLKIAAIIPENINSVVFYDKTVDAHLKRTECISNDMYSILKSGQLTVEIQPTYDLNSGECVSAEALARWKHPELGNISPTEFIPIAETIGMINDIDMYILESVCKYMRSWMDMGIQPVPISVNQSRMHISDPTYVSSVFSLMQKYDIWPNLIVLETTESCAFNDYSRLTEVLGQLHNYGFILSMDDFGSGYSSLHMLNELEYDVLKLDIKLVQSCRDSFRSRTIIKHIVSMAHALKMRVVAEGVETKEQAALMTELGCDTAQGFYFARPMSIENFEASIFGYVNINS